MQQEPQRASAVYHEDLILINLLADPGLGKYFLLSTHFLFSVCSPVGTYCVISLKRKRKSRKTRKQWGAWTTSIIMQQCSTSTGCYWILIVFLVWVIIPFTVFCLLKWSCFHTIYKFFHYKFCTFPVVLTVKPLLIRQLFLFMSHCTTCILLNYMCRWVFTFWGIRTEVRFKSKII